MSLIKCEDESKMRNRNKNVNILSNNYISYAESDSEYETEEVYELREWYPPDFWKSNNFIDNKTSNLNHIRNNKGNDNIGEEDTEENINNNKVTKPFCLTDVTVDDLTITMMESQTEKGFFKTL